MTAPDHSEEPQPDVGDKLRSALRHHQLGQLQEARRLYEQILEGDPDHADALHLLGVMAHQEGNGAQAESLIRRAIRCNPKSPIYFDNLGAVYQEENRLGEAITCYQKALAVRPDYAPAFFNMGNAHKKQGNTREAIACFQAAVALAPDFAQAYNNMGNALQAEGRAREAIDCYRRALDLEPNHFRAMNNMGAILQEEGNLAQAVVYYQEAIRLRPDCDEVHYNLGNTFREQGRLTEAIACYQKATEINPVYTQAYNNKGNALKEQGRIPEAISCLEKALELQPDYTQAHSNLLFGLHYQDRIDPLHLFLHHQEWGQRHAPGCDDAPRSRNNGRASERRLRVGYVSPDFRAHAVAYFAEPIMASHDPEAFEVFSYSDVARPDSTTDRLRALSTNWRDISAMDDNQAKNLIRSDRIDILVDLAGHSANNRMPLFAAKPAPVQVTYLGYPDTTGLATMDYRITDAYADPLGTTEPYHTEELVRLPDSFLCYRPPRETPDVSDPPARVSGRITFGSFNHRPKITPSVARLWAEILLALPDAQLVLKSRSFSDQQTRRSLQEMFTGAGIASDRITFVSYVPSHFDHLDLYNRIDIGLDTFPYNGTTTICEALWMGVPVITLAGEIHPSRVGMSLLSNVGLPELIAGSPQEYVDKALQLAGDLERLRALRSGLRSMMADSCLMNEGEFTRSLESVYRQMWHRYDQTPEEQWGAALLDMGRDASDKVALDGRNKLAH